MLVSRSLRKRLRRPSLAAHCEHTATTSSVSDLYRTRRTSSWRAPVSALGAPLGPVGDDVDV